MGLSRGELVALNYRLLIDGITPFTDMYKALADCYARLPRREPNADAVLSNMTAANELIGLDELLDIEQRTTEQCSIET